MAWLDPGIAFSIGFLGSIHCVGMCGGIVAALSMERRDVWRPGLALYHIGRLSTYTILGLASGFLGSLATHGGIVTGTQSWLSIFAGLFIVMFALQVGGWVPERFGPLSRIAIPPALFRRISEGKSCTAFGLIGLINGLLPCGMVYAALALAVKQADPLKGSLIMTAFGLGTVPAMTALAMIIRRLNPFVRGQFLKGAAVVMILFGLFTIFRGMAPIHPDHNHPTGLPHDQTQSPNRR